MEEYMMNIEKSEKAHRHKPDSNNGQGNDFVEIYINDVLYSVHRGQQKVTDIKVIGAVSSTDILYQMPDYIELDNSGGLVIRGGEHFKSVAPSGSSS
jgi:hypothetical protein